MPPARTGADRDLASRAIGVTSRVLDRDPVPDSSWPFAARHDRPGAAADWLPLRVIILSEQSPGSARQYLDGAAWPSRRDGADREERRDSEYRLTAGCRRGGRRGASQFRLTAAILGAGLRRKAVRAATMAPASARFACLVASAVLTYRRVSSVAATANPMPASARHAGGRALESPRDVQHREAYPHQRRDEIWRQWPAAAEGGGAAMPAHP
jgi:hypothetical protein